ncbi:MAG: hypothetical protein WC869_11430 [Phycisphaerae bacterium]|jgi:outer membrane lipoprotein-sorting protein
MKIEVQPLKDQAVLDELLAAQTSARQAARPASRRRNLFMKTVRWFTPAAAVAALAIVIVQLAGPGAGQAYGMDGAEKLLRQAQTLHIKGWGFMTDPTGKEPVKSMTEFWADLPSQLFYSRQPGYTNNSGKVTWFETIYVSNGQLAMTVNTGDKTVSFSRLTPLQAKLQMEENTGSLIERLFGPTAGKEWSKIGRDKVGSEELEVWERLVSTDGSTEVKTKSWLDPKTGDLRRVELFRKEGDAEWRPLGGFDTIERNVTPPVGIFSMDAPKGYTLLNPRSKPKTQTFMQSSYWVGKLGLEVQWSFVLEDGTVIIPWRCIDKDAKNSEAEQIGKLELGGELPKLPVEIYGVSQVPPAPDITYIGRHLATTVKDGNAYEWGIFVPTKTPPKVPLAYRLLVRLNTKPDAAKGTMKPEAYARSVNRQQYESLVLSAMADLSDSGTPPPISYDQIEQLAGQIRESMPAK